MHKFENHIYSEYLREKSQALILTINDDSKILSVNEFSHKALGKDIEGLLLSDIFNIYEKINFEDYAKSKNLLQLNLKTSGELPLTYLFSVYSNQKRLLLIGEQNYQDNENLKKNFIQTNSELNNLMREMRVINKELKKLNKLKNQFLGMAAHDLRNPISIITTYCSMLLDRPKENFTDNEFDMISNIHKSSHFMLSLLEDLLDITKIEAGKIDLNYQEVNIINLLKSVTELNQINSNDKNISIQTSYSSLCKKLITIDENKIIQVLNNLISNAVKYSERNTAIKISFVDSGNFCVIAVQDHGQGIDKNELNSLFEAYTTTSTKSTAGEKSTGLGLKIARDIVTSHEGSIWVESEIGQGSTFYVSLPYESDRIDKLKQNITEAEIIKPPIFYQPEKLKILVIDDDNMQRVLMERLLSKYTSNVYTLGSGEEAYKYLQENKVDLIFIDENMPQMSGVECINKLRKDKIIHESTKVIGVSANKAETSFQGCSLDYAFQKPISSKFLKKIFPSSPKDN